MSFYIRCMKGHRGFTVTLQEAEDGEGESTGIQLVLLACNECGEEEVLEVAESEWRKGIQGVMGR